MTQQEATALLRRVEARKLRHQPQRGVSLYTMVFWTVMGLGVGTLLSFAILKWVKWS